MRSGIDRLKAAGFVSLETKPSIIGGIAKDKDPGPPIRFGAHQAFTDEFASDARALPFRHHRKRTKPKSTKRSTHVRERHVTYDPYALDRHEREHRVACIPQV